MIPMELDPNFLISAAVIMLIGIGGLITATKLGAGWFQTKTEKADKQTIAEYKQLLNLKDESILAWKKQYQTWKGRAFAAQLPPQVEGDPQDLETIIPNLIKSYRSMAPKWAQPLLDSPGITDLAIKLAKENPAKAKDIISAFIRPANDKSQDEQFSPLPGQYA